MLSSGFLSRWGHHQALLWALLLGLAGTACAPARAGRPAWVVARQSAEFPATRFFTGVGQADSADEAEARARADLQARLVAETRARLERLLAPAPAAGLRLARPEAALELLAAPPPAQLAERWQSADGARHAALAALERTALGAALGAQVQAFAEQIEAARRTAAGLLAAEPYPGLLHALGAYALLAQAQDARACLEALSPDAPAGGPPGPDEAALLQGLDRALAAVELFAPAQAAWRAGEEGRSALLLAGARAASTGEALPGVPLRFHAGPQGLTRVARTDQAGLVSVELDVASLATSGARLELGLGLDGRAALEEAGLDPEDARFAPLVARLDAPRLRQAVSRPASGGARVALLVAELRSGKFQPDSRAAQALAQALAARGLRTRAAAELSFELEGEPTPARVAAALAGQAELAVYGVVQTSPDGRKLSGLAFAVARGELVAVRLPDGEVLGRYEGTARGAGLDAGQAEGRALEAFARAALAELMPGLSRAAPAGAAP